MSPPYTNYLKTYRKRTALSQEEVSFLLGAPRGGANVSRYERGLREPSLDTTLACEVIFRTSTKELYAGRSQKVERRTRKRAAQLGEKLEASGAETAALTRKLEALEAISCSSSSQ